MNINKLIQEGDFDWISQSDDMVETSYVIYTDDDSMGMAAPEWLTDPEREWMFNGKVTPIVEFTIKFPKGIHMDRLTEIAYEIYDELIEGDMNPESVSHFFSVENDKNIIYIDNNNQSKVNLGESADFDWIREVQITLEPNTTYYFIPSLNIPEFEKLIGSVMFRDTLDDGILRQIKGLVKSGPESWYNDGNPDILYVVTNNNGLIDGWQNTIDNRLETLEDVYSVKRGNTKLIDGRTLLFPDTINEQQEGFEWIEDTHPNWSSWYQYWGDKIINSLPSTLGEVDELDSGGLMNIIYSLDVLQRSLDDYIRDEGIVDNLSQGTLDSGIYKELYYLFANIIKSISNRDDGKPWPTSGRTNESVYTRNLESIKRIVPEIVSHLEDNNL